MARLASIEKLGYYPLPPVAQQRLGHLLTAKPGAHLRLFDPFVGEGVALRYFADELQHFNTNPKQPLTITTYGIELSHVRAQAAAKVVDHVIQADYENVRTPDEAFSMLYNNPQFDLEAANDEHIRPGARRARLEYQTLRNTLSRLQLGGLLLYIIPQGILARENVAKFLCAHLSRLTIYRFPTGEYELFDQVAVLGYRQKQTPPTLSAVERIVSMGKGTTKVPHIPTPTIPMPAHLTWELPSATLPEDQLIFQRHHLTDDDLIALYQTQNAFQTDTWRTFISPPPPTHFTPLIPLRPNHLAALISSGQVGSVALPDPDRPGHNLLAKGVTVKRVTEEEDPDAKQKQERKQQHNVKKLTEDYHTTIYQLHTDGTHSQLDNPSTLNAFLKTHTDPLAQLLDERYHPLYTGPTLAEWTQAAHYVPYKKLPGRDTPGLLDAQKHTLIAGARSCRTYGWTDLIGEMGCGKTAISSATTDLLDAYPVLITAPTHTLENWQQEIRDTIPGAQGHIIDSLRSLLAFVRNWRPGKKWFAIMSYETAKNGPGWRPATLKRKWRVPGLDADNKPITYIATFHCCPRCGHPAWQEPTPHMPADDHVDAVKKQSTRQFCRGPRRLWEGDPAGDNTKGQWVSTKLQDVTDEEDGVKTLTRDKLYCGAPLFTYTGIRRWPLAHYIKKHLPTFFRAYIADEVHMAAGKSTDQAIAYHRLLDSVKYTINATGTWFSGYATSLFYPRYRLDPAVRAEFSYHDEQRWAQLYGRIERTVDDVATWTSDGAFSGAHRYTLNVRELPGLSPLIYRRLLQTAIFLRIDNLGYQLPPYEEIVVPIPMSRRQEADYNLLYDTLMARIMEGRGLDADLDDKEIAQKLLPVWLQNCLSRPNSAFRTEMVQWKPPGSRHHVPYTTLYDYDLAPDQLQLPSGHTWHKADYQAAITLAADADDTASTAPEIAEGIDACPEWAPSGNEGACPELAEGDDLALPSNHWQPNPETELSPDHFSATDLSPNPNQTSNVIPKQQPTIPVPFLLPAIIKDHELLPKEEWLLDFATTELAQRRRVLLYVRQTGTRDIQPRLVDVLARANLRTLILPDKVKPIKRMSWISANMPLLDVLATNPRKVSTGVNLVQFASIVFYEIEYSLFTLVQAMRRVWRLGQTLPVRVVFPIYQATIEQQAFHLMADKMAGMRLLYGDNATGAFANGSNDLGGNLLTELARRLANGQTIVQSNGITSLLTVNSQQTNEWSHLITPPLLEAARPTPPTNGNHNGNSHHATAMDQLFDDAFASLFATITNPHERRQRDAGQIGLFI